LIGVTSVLAAAPLAAGSANAQLTVGVIVARSCVVDAQPAAQLSSRVRLECASGAARGLRLSGVTRIGGSARTTELLAPTLPFSGAASQRDLRVLTVNF
jgi:hypothetical protein